MARASLIESCGDDYEVEVHKRTTPLICMSRTVDLTDLLRLQLPPLHAVEFLRLHENDPPDGQVQTHADGVGGDDVLHLSRQKAVHHHKLDISRYIAIISKIRENGFLLTKEQELRAANIPFDETEDALRELFFQFLHRWQQGEPGKSLWICWSGSNAP